MRMRTEIQNPPQRIIGTLQGSGISLLQCLTRQTADFLFFSRNVYETHMKSDYTGGHRTRTKTGVNKLPRENG